VHAGNGEVESILGRLRWQRLTGDERRGERNCRICNLATSQQEMALTPSPCASCISRYLW